MEELGRHTGREGGRTSQQSKSPTCRHKFYNSKKSIYMVMLAICGDQGRCFIFNHQPTTESGLLIIINLQSQRIIMGPAKTCLGCGGRYCIASNYHRHTFLHARTIVLRNLHRCRDYTLQALKTLNKGDMELNLYYPYSYIVIVESQDSESYMRSRALHANINITYTVAFPPWRLSKKPCIVSQSEELVSSREVIPEIVSAANKLDVGSLNEYASSDIRIAIDY